MKKRFTEEQIVAALRQAEAGVTVGVPELPNIALRVLLTPPHPNPLRSGDVVTIEFSLPQDALVTVELFDARGRRAARRAPESFPASDAAKARWNPGPLASGVYFLRLSGQNLVASSGRLVVVN